MFLCAGLIVWAHAQKHIYFGLRANQPEAFIASMPPAEQEYVVNQEVITIKANNYLFRLPTLHHSHLRVASQDSLHSRLLFNGFRTLWLPALQ
ncbi:hypothetical protein DCM91_18950 [Chitinophaga costaii]|nr:hypothetical protein DCM91_18950 [Chitinophaga costaii]